MHTRKAKPQMELSSAILLLLVNNIQAIKVRDTGDLDLPELKDDNDIKIEKDWNECSRLLTGETVKKSFSHPLLRLHSSPLSIPTARSVAKNPRGTTSSCDPGKSWVRRWRKEKEKEMKMGMRKRESRRPPRTTRNEMAIDTIWRSRSIGIGGSE